MISNKVLQEMQELLHLRSLVRLSMPTLPNHLLELLRTIRRNLWPIALKHIKSYTHEVPACVWLLPCQHLTDTHTHTTQKLWWVYFTHSIMVA